MGGSSSSSKPATTSQNPDADMNYMLLKAQVDAVSDLYSRIMDQCYKKCISSFNEQELTKGEGVCVDRCVSKYMEMQTKMQIRLSSIGQQAAVAPPSVGTPQQQ